jgi:DNA polymerase III alpha subunit (gram-positive type)
VSNDLKEGKVILTCLIFDTETNGLDTKNGFVQELAWMLVETTTWRCIQANSFIIRWPTHYEVEPGALETTGLDKNFCYNNGFSPLAAFTNFLSAIEFADYLCGHNSIAFDHPMMLTNFKRGMLFDVPLDHKFNTMTHIDTLLDCEYPPQMKVKGLKYLALDHGFVHLGAHQALADVQATAHILSKYDFKRTVEIARTPVVKVTSHIDWDEIELREKVKQAKFMWNPKLKVWEKYIREFFVPNLQLSLGDDVSLCVDQPQNDPLSCFQ